MATIKGGFSKHSNRNLNVVQQKGNLLSIQLRLLDQTLEDPKKNFNEKVNSVLGTWERVGALVRSSTADDSRNVIIDLHRYTVLVVLDDDWSNVKTAVKTHIKVIVEKFANELANRDERESESRCRAILRLVEEPWGRNLKSVVSDTPCSESDAERFLNSDRLILRLRLQTLLESRRLCMALQLVEFVWRWRRSRPEFFSGYTKRELDYMANIYLILLCALKREKDIIIKLKELELNECHEVVQRLLSLSDYDDLSSGERRLCRHASKIAKLGAQFLLTKAMLGSYTPELEDYVQVWLELHKDIASDPEHLVEMIRKMVAHAQSIRHVVTFCKVLQSKLGVSQRLVCIELYIRSLTNEMNLMERHRTNHEISEAHEAELRLSEGFIELSHLLESNLRVRRECVLTAFSLNPTSSTLDRLSSVAHLPDNPDTGQTTDADVELTPESSLDANSLGLTESLCSDLSVVLFCHRYQDLSWNVGWTRLEEECKRYLKSVESGARNVDPELKYLNIDYEQFKDWPEEEEDGDNGIERGYEPTTNSEDEDDDEDDDFSQTSASESSDFIDRRQRRPKKPKQLSDSSDDTGLDVATKGGVARPKKYKSRRGRTKYLDGDAKTGFQFQRRESKKLGRPPLSKTKRGMKHGARRRPGDGLGNRPGVLSSVKSSARPPGRHPIRMGRPGPRPSLRAVARPIQRPIMRQTGLPAVRQMGLPVIRQVSIPIVRHDNVGLPGVPIVREMGVPVVREVGLPVSRPHDSPVRRLGRPPKTMGISRPSLQTVNNINNTNTSIKVENKYPDVNEDEVKNLLSPNRNQSSPSVVKTLRNFRTPKKKQVDLSRADRSDSSREDNVERFAPMLSTLNLNPKIVLDRHPLVEQYMSSSKQKGGLSVDGKRALANSVPGLDSLDMIMPCPQEATVQVVQISGQIPVPGQSTEDSTVKTESEDDQCSDHVNGKGNNQSESNPASEDPSPSHNSVDVMTSTPTTPTTNPSTTAVLLTSNLVTENHSGLLRLGERLMQDSASSMQVSSTQGNDTDRRDLLQIEANVRGNVVTSSHNWPGGLPKPETSANAIKKTDKRSGHRRQMSTQTASLPQFHQVFGKQVYPGQQGASGDSRPAAAAAASAPTAGTSPATATAATAVTASVASSVSSASAVSVASSGAARGNNALKQALAGGNSARLIQVPGEPSLLLQAISSDNVVQKEVKLPMSSGNPLPETQRPSSSMLMKQLTSPVASAHTVKPATNLLLTTSTSAVIVNSNRPATFGAASTATPVTESLSTKSVNTQTTASSRDAVITSVQTSSPVVIGTPTSRPVTAQSIYFVKRKQVGQTSTGTLTTNLNATTVSSSQNVTAVSLTEEERSHRAPVSVAFNRRIRKTPVSMQTATLKFVKPGLQERFSGPMLGVLNQASPRSTAETALASGATGTSASPATSPATRPLRQPTPPALVTSTTLEQQLREFESVLEQVTTTSQLKERRLNPEDPSPTTPPVTTANVSFSGDLSSAVEKAPELQNASPSRSVTPSAVATNSATVATATSLTTSPVVTSAVSVTFSTQPTVVQTLHKLSPIVVSTSFTQTQPVAVASPSSVTSQSSSSPSTTPSSSVPGTPSKSSKSKPKSVKTSAVQASVKTSPIAKSQKTQEDEQTTARILSILRQYDEQLRCSPDLNNKPAPRRRNNHQTHPSPNSKRKKSGSKSKPSSASDMSPSTDDTHTLGSEDSSGMASQPSGELGDVSLTEDEAPPRASIFSAAPSPVITAAVPSTPSTTPSPTSSLSTSTTMCIATPTLVTTANTTTPQSDTSPTTAAGETQPELETKSFSSVMPVYMVPVSSSSSLPVVVSAGTQMLHVHPVNPNGAPLVNLGGNVQVPVVVRQIPAKQLSGVTTLEGAVQAQSANTTAGDIANPNNAESRPDTILLNVAHPTRTNTSQPVMAIMPTFHQILTTVSSANTSVTPTTHIRLPAVSTPSTSTSVVTASSDMTLSGESETTTNSRPATLLGLQLLQQQRSAKQRAQPKPAEQPSQLQQLLSQDQTTPSLQPAAKQGHVFMKGVCVMKSVKSDQEPPILLQISKMRDDNQESSTNQVTVQVSSPQQRVLKPSQPVTTIAASSTDTVARSEPSQVLLMRQTPQPVPQVEQVQQQVLQLVQAQQPSQTAQPAQATETEPPRLQVQQTALQTLPKAKPTAQSVGQPTVQTQPVQTSQLRPVLQNQQTGPAQQSLFTVQFSQRHQQLLNVRQTQKVKQEHQLQLTQHAIQMQQQTHQLQLQLHQKQQLLQHKRQQVQTQTQPQPQSQSQPQSQPQPQPQLQSQPQPQPQSQPQPQPQSQPQLQTQPQPLHQLPESVSSSQQEEPKMEPKEELSSTPPESPTNSLKPVASPSASPVVKDEDTPPSSPQRSSPHCTPSSPTSNRNSSVPEGENTNESSADSPASSNTMNMPSSGIDGDTSPDRSPGGPISCWRYTESRTDRDRVKLTAKLPARVQPAVSKPPNKRKPPLNMYPCSLSKSLSEECEDLGVDRPSTRELFPDTDLFLDSNLSPSFAHTDSPSNSQDGVSTSPEPPDKKKKYLLLRSFPPQKSDISSFLCSDSNKDERKQNGEPVLKCSEVPIDTITAGVALASEVTAASPLPALASSITSNREEASSPEACMGFMHQGRVTTYTRRRPIRDEWEREPLRPSSSMDEDFWHEPLVDDKEDLSEGASDVDGHCASPASNGTDPLASRLPGVPASVAASMSAGVAAAVAAAVAVKPLSTTSMTTRRGALKRKDVVENDATKRDIEKKTEKKVRRSAPARPPGPQEPEEEDTADEKRGSALRSKRTAMNRTEVFPRDAKKKAPEESQWREATAAPAATVRRTSLRARLPGQPGSPAPSTFGANVEPSAVVSTPPPPNKSVTKLDRNAKKSKASKSIKGIAHKKK